MSDKLQGRYVCTQKEEFHFGSGRHTVTDMQSGETEVLDEGDPNYCEGTADHKHVIDICGPADGDPSIVDVCCRVCGRSGSFAIDPKEVNW
jgi:hypothetical protein